MRKGMLWVIMSVISLLLTACGNNQTSQDGTAVDTQVQSSTVEAEELSQENPEGNNMEEAAAAEETNTRKETAGEENGLELSDLQVRVTCQERTAVFRLYDTAAAAEFYEQLPLELELSNFSDAQWMFYPPERLDVTEEEAYHDGKKGELSYYEPWGDVFMLYEDFYAGDLMHRLGVGVSGVDDIEGMSGMVVIEKDEQADVVVSEQAQVKKIRVEAGEDTIVFELNDSPAAQDLYEQLPLSIDVENFSNNEKIFYPPQELDTTGTPQAEAGVGTLAYYAPWGDVVMFYGEFGSASGLYELGQAVSGAEFIESLTGTIEISQAD